LKTLIKNEETICGKNAKMYIFGAKELWRLASKKKNTGHSQNF